MSVAKQILLWLALAFTCFLPSSAVTVIAPENCTSKIFSTGYDAPIAEAISLGSHTETSTSNYDTAPIHSAIAEKIPTEANRTLFGPNAELKAAEGGATFGRAASTDYRGTFFAANPELGASGMSISTIVYGEQIQLSGTYNQASAVAYDSSGESTVGYGAISVLATNDKENGAAEDRVPFVQFAGFLAAESVTTPIGELRSAGLADAHHVIQDAAVRDLEGYDTSLAPGVQLQGPSTAIGSPHYLATQAQRAAGGGTYGAERQIAIQSLQASGKYSAAEIDQIMQETDAYFNGIGVNNSTVTRIPGNRRSP